MPPGIYPHHPLLVPGDGDIPPAVLNSRASKLAAMRAEHPWLDEFINSLDRELAEARDLHRQAMIQWNKCIIGRIADGEEATATIKELADALASLNDRMIKVSDLLTHCWVHSNYPNNGRDQMTTAQRQLFDEITSG